MTKRKQLQILKTAENLFNRFGVKKTAVDDIARDAKVAKATIYNYFGNKEGLLKALIMNKIQQFEYRLMDLTEKTNPVDAIKTLLHEHVRFFKDTPFFNDPFVLNDELNKELNKKEEHFLHTLVEQAKAKGLLAVGDSSAILNTLLLVIKGIESRIKNSITSSLDSFDDNIEFIAQTFFNTKKINGGENGTH